MAKPAYSTSRRAMLAGIFSILPVVAFATDSGLTEVEAAYHRLLLARATPLQNGDTLYIEDLLLEAAKPETMADWGIKARYAEEMRKKGDDGPSARLVQELAQNT